MDSGVLVRHYQQADSQGGYGWKGDKSQICEKDKDNDSNNNKDEDIFVKKPKTQPTI